MSYGIDQIEQFRLAATYIDRILKGGAFGQSTDPTTDKVQSGDHVKTAKALGLDVPPSILARADEVIE